MSTSEKPVSKSVEAAEAAAPEKTRRELLRMGGYAAAVAPAMLVLMSGKGHAVPPCNNPSYSNGHTNSGHSGC